MKGREIIGNAIVSFLLRIACTIHAEELEKVPQRGPLILLSNHTSNIEGPIYYIHLHPRKRTALGKQELWQNPATRFLMDAWGVIPVRRGLMDRRTLQACLDALDRSYILGVAPEGTRSRSGVLHRGRTGATYLATRSRVPILPIVQWGLQHFSKNVRRLKKTRVYFKVGRPFFVEKPGGGTVTSADRKKMTDEMMYQLAALLPPSLRGRYGDTTGMTTNYLRFTTLGAVGSNGGSPG